MPPTPNNPPATNQPLQPSSPLHSPGAAALLDLLPHAVICMDHEFRFTYANAAGLVISRLQPSQFNGPTQWEAFPETLGTPLEVAYRAALATGASSHLEYFYPPFALWLDLFIAPFAEGILLHFTDITERKRAEDQRDALTRQLHQILEASPDGIVIIDRDWRFTFANNRALELVNTPEILGHNIFELFPGNNDAPFGTAYRLAMEQGIAGEFEAFHPAPLDIWTQVQVRPHDQGIIVFFSDVTSRKQAELREQETAQRLAEVLEVTSDAIVSFDRDWRYTFLNRTAKEMLDPQDRLLGTNLWEEFPAAVHGPWWDIYHRSMDEGITGGTDVFYGPPLNRNLAVRSHATPEGIVVFFQDVTQQRSRERILGQQQELLALVQRNARLATWEADLIARTIHFGIGAYPVFGHPQQQIATFASLRAIVDPAFLPETGSTIWSAVQQRQSFTVDFPVTAADGSIIWIESRGNPTLVHGVVTHLTGISIDITDRKQQEQALASSEERYRVLADLNPQAIWAGAPSGEVTYANQGFLDYLGLTIPQLADGRWLEIVHPDDQPAILAAWTLSHTTGVDYDIDVHLRRASDRAFRWWNLRALPVRDEHGAITSWLGVGQDIHDARTASEALQRQQQETERQRLELETVYRTAPIGLSLLDPVEFRYLRVNERQSQLMGYPESSLLGRSVLEVAPVPGLLPLLQQAASGTPVVDHLLEGELLARPGEHRSFTVNYRPVYGPSGRIEAISTAAIEVTNQRRSEAALIQSEKLAAVGRLASSISHEINNPLEAVTNLLYLVSSSEKLAAEESTYVSMAQSELSRVSQIVTQTLRFHRQAVAPTYVISQELVTAVLDLYQGRLANSSIRIDARYLSSTAILCFENDIRQVLNNLIANAIDAMRGGGRLLLRAHDAHNPQGEPGVRITIADTGHGMPSSVVERIFEPFYTTKDLNGTGLGLWISSGIVQRHHGCLRVRSSARPDAHGTIFSLFLPLLFLPLKEPEPA